MNSKGKQQDRQTENSCSENPRTHGTSLYLKVTSSQELSMEPTTSASARNTTPAVDNISNPTANSHTPKVERDDLFYATVVNGWRRCGEQEKQCTKDIAELKQDIRDSKQELHNTSNAVQELKQSNDLLMQEIRKSKDVYNVYRRFCEDFTAEILHLNADKELLQQRFQQMKHDVDNLSELLNMNRSDVSNESLSVRELQSEFASVQNRRYELEKDVQDLNRTVISMRDVKIEAKQKHRSDLEAYEESIQQAMKKLSQLEEEKARKEDIIEKNKHIYDDLNDAQAKLQKERDALQQKLDGVSHRWVEDLVGRLMTYWNNSLEQREVAIHMLHRIAFYVLPAIPQPENALFDLRTVLIKTMNFFKN